MEVYVKLFLAMQNKEKALNLLRARIYASAKEERHAKLSADRKSQVGSGDR